MYDEIVKYKIFVTFNSSRKQKILIFFAVTDCGTMRHIVTQARGQAFYLLWQALEKLGRAFKILGQAFGFLFRLQKLKGHVFQKHGLMF